MKNKLFLISMLLIASLIFLSGCFAKRNGSSETGATTETPASQAESMTGSAADGNEGSDIEEDIPTAEYVDNYTVELKEDEVFEIN